MQLVNPSRIAEIDNYAAKELCLSETLLMGRAGEAVAACAAEWLPDGGLALILCGGGNNGGDGYAAAMALRGRGYRVVCVDVFGKGQRSEAGKYYLAGYSEEGAPLGPSSLGHFAFERLLADSDLVIDAVFGTGFLGELPSDAAELAERISSSGVPVLAVDVPLGVNAQTGGVHPHAVKAVKTVCLSFYKRGLFSYPARDFCGELVLDSLGIPEETAALFGADTYLTDEAFARGLLAPRAKNTHKGSFGRAALIAGSTAYRGAACLAAEGAFRMGAGLVELISEERVLQTAIRRLPEAIAHPVLPAKERGERENAEILSAAERAGAVLFGPGLGRAESLLDLLISLLHGEGAPLVIDADGINLLASVKEKRELLRGAKRSVILTPHPLEFARLADMDVAAVQACRLPRAEDFAKDTGSVVVLKGAGTVITDGRVSYINASGSPSLSKGGSGDVLAGMVTGLLLQGISPIEAAALGAYLHGAAGDLLEEAYSDRGVLPSELPRAAARVIRRLQKDK